MNNFAACLPGLARRLAGFASSEHSRRSIFNGNRAIRFGTGRSSLEIKQSLRSLSVPRFSNGPDEWVKPRPIKPQI
jgi:hypothetical protein